MKHLFVPYEIAVKLKELGFDELCMAIYFRDEFRFIGINSLKETNSQINNIDFTDSPLYQQVIDWFRVKHDTHIWITGISIFEYTIATPEQIIPENDGSEDYYETLTEAIEVALTLI